MRLNFHDMLAIVGSGFIVAGVWHLSAAAGMIALGIVLVALAWMLDGASNKTSRKER